ncbi:MAG: hypothetical protein WCF44_14635 [Candidatus Methylophosphatis roskildensis]
MPVVFVHGVNNRKEDPGYTARQLLTEKFFKKHLANAKVAGKTLATVTPRFPYWGDLATRFAWDNASLPSGEINALGAPGVEDDLRPLIAILQDALADPKAARKEPLLALAAKSFPQAVGVISDLLLRGATPADADRITEFICAAQAYAEAKAVPVWLPAVSTDAQFFNKLVSETNAASVAAGVQALGGFDFILNPLAAAAAKLKGAVASAANTVLDKTGDFASTKLLAWGRRPLNAVVGRFFGDVFAYLHERGDKNAPGLIPKLILAEIDQAIGEGPPGEPLVIIAHSLGGVICFDLLSYFRTDIDVDLFISVGSQVSHFEEMKRFKASNPAIPSPLQKLAPTPPNIKHWINVFDEVDIFSYACEKVFDRVVDFGYDTETYTIKAHGAYFEQDRFYSRLRARIDQLP